MRFELVTPAKLLAHSEDAVHVIAPGADGYFGVMEGHMNLISSLDSRGGKVTVESEGDRKQSYQVGGGFVEVTPEGVRILAESAEEI